MTRRLPPKENRKHDYLQTEDQECNRDASHESPVARRNAKPAAKLAGTATSASAACGSSKTAKILDLLKRPGGVTLKDFAKATGWQPNSVRGFLSGAIGKKMATPVESFKSSDGDRSYRLSK